MKVHYTNILLFAVPLNTLVNDQSNYNIPKRTPNSQLTKSHRSLFECDLYMAANYDNDPQMKDVMVNFNKQTQQRFHEYDNRMKEKRKECKDQCDKESQKIILKDKLEKELMDKFATLDTDIQNDAIPTCICEKSIADKVEKGCLRCGGILGAAMPELGAMGAIALYTLSQWQTKAIAAAKAASITEATDLATQEGMKAVISKIKVWSIDFIDEPGYVDFTSVVSKLNFKCPTALHKSAMELASSKSCNFAGPERGTVFCNTVRIEGTNMFNSYAEAGAQVYEKTLASQTTVLQEAKMGAVEAKYAFWQTANIAPIIAIVVIVLIMVIIYLILRRRRKTKMKKKFQYIKLLEE
ncbi:PIR protein, putative [Plasmodium sp. DRC-Itaito]|nr:PIR protein, putative [Plasmodium sp. DRC-Itaito]